MSHWNQLDYPFRVSRSDRCPEITYISTRRQNVVRFPFGLCGVTDGDHTVAKDKFQLKVFLDRCIRLFSGHHHNFFRGLKVLCSPYHWLSRNFTIFQTCHQLSNLVSRFWQRQRVWQISANNAGGISFPSVVNHAEQTKAVCNRTSHPLFPFLFLYSEFPTVTQ